MKKIMLLLILILVMGCKGDMGNFPTAPVIEQVNLPGRLCNYKDKVAIEVKATDVNGDPLTYAWLCTDGSFVSKEANRAVWAAPEITGECLISVIVSDGYRSVREDIILTVSAAPLDLPLENNLTTNASGFVGIGTKIPEANLHVKGENGDVGLRVEAPEGDAEIVLKNGSTSWNIRLEGDNLKIMKGNGTMGAEFSQSKGMLLPKRGGSYRGSVVADGVWHNVEGLENFDGHILL